MAVNTLTPLRQHTWVGCGVKELLGQSLLGVWGLAGSSAVHSLQPRAAYA